jgi:PTHB1 C-terminus
MTKEDFSIAAAHLPPHVRDTDDIGWEEITDASIVELLRGPLAKNAQEKAATASVVDAFTTCETFKRHLEIFVDRLEAARGQLSGAV